MDFWQVLQKSNLLRLSGGFYHSGTLRLALFASVLLFAIVYWDHVLARAKSYGTADEQAVAPAVSESGQYGLLKRLHGLLDEHLLSHPRRTAAVSATLCGWMPWFAREYPGVLMILAGTRDPSLYGLSSYGVRLIVDALEWGALLSWVAVGLSLIIAVMTVVEFRKDRHKQEKEKIAKEARAEGKRSMLDLLEKKGLLRYPDKGQSENIGTHKMASETTTEQEGDRDEG